MRSLLEVIFGPHFDAERDTVVCGGKGVLIKASKTAGTVAGFLGHFSV